MAAGNPYLDDAPAAGGNPYLDDTPAPASAPAKPDAAPKQWGFADYATDGVRSLLNGVGKGVAGVVGLPGDALRLGQAGLDYSQSVGQGRDYEAVAAENRNRGAVGIPDVVAQRVAQGARTLGSENIQANLPTQYEPQSRAGKVISEAANFATQGAALPLGAGRAAAAGVGAVAGVGSDVAGQATEGTAAEPYARLAGAIAAPLGVAAAQIPGAAQRAVVREAGAVPQAELSQILSQAQGLLDTAAQNGTKLSAFQAIDQASGGRMNLSEIQRQAEGMGRLRGFFADMGDTNREAAGRQFGRVGEESDSALGGRVAQAADVAIQRTPEGARLNQAQAALGPRVEAREAGEAMQSGLGQTRAEREAARSAAADPLYDAARNAPERIGVDRYVDVERPGDFGLVTRDGDPAARPRFSTEGPQLDPVASGMSGTSGPRPESLARFVAKNGGVELLGGEARAADLHRYNIPGVGKVAREDGKSIDSFWREKLTGEDGYFPGDTSKDIRDRLISALEEERAGRPVFRPQDQQSAERLGLTRSREADELAGRRSQAEGDLLRDAEREGLREADLTPDVRARAVDYLAGGYERDPLQAYERAANELRQPPARRPATTEERGPNVTEQVYAPRFGQVNPQIAIDHVERAIELGAKGEHAAKLSQIRGMLNNSRGETDLTTRGLMGADRAIASLVSQARTSGDGPLVRELMQAKAALRDAMETAPEVAQANRTFERLSRPLDNFDGSRPAGKITERDEFGRRNVLDPEFVPDQIRGSTAAREFNEAATPAAREAYRGRLTTQIMDEAGGREATGEAIRAALTKNADLLREHPGVVARLTARAEAEEGMTAVRNGPLGRLVDENQTASEAASKLFPTGQAAQDFSPEEVGRAVGALAAENPRAAGSLVRTRLQGAFDSVARDVNTAGGQMGAAKFRNAIYGNTREAEHIRAAVRALPDGETVLQGLDRLFDVFQAQGLRQNVGSKTAYNQQFLEEASKGGTLEGVAKAAVNPIKLPSRFGKMIEEWRLGRNMDQIAAMVTNPDARAAFRGLLKSGDISGPVGRLATIAARSQAQAPLQITVQPRGQDR